MIDTVSSRAECRKGKHALNRNLNNLFAIFAILLEVPNSLAILRLLQELGAIIRIQKRLALVVLLSENFSFRFFTISSNCACLKVIGSSIVAALSFEESLRYSSALISSSGKNWGVAEISDLGTVKCSTSSLRHFEQIIFFSSKGFSGVEPEKDAEDCVLLSYSFFS